MSLYYSVLLLSGCASYGVVVNVSTEGVDPAKPYSVKALAGRRGGGEFSLMLAFSGGGSRAAAHARLLRLVREKKIDIPLMDGISKMTYLIARYLQDNGVEQMAHKGRIQVGADADITVFDPETVKDNGPR